MGATDDTETAKSFLADFITKMNTQDNRGTATPYFYVIQSSRHRVDEHDPEWHEWIDEDYQTIYRADSEDGLLEELIAKGMTDEEAHAEMDKYSHVGMRKECTEHGCFFTEEEAKAHLEANAHHYSEDARTYVKHFWRAPQVAEFFKCVGIVAGVPFQTK